MSLTSSPTSPLSTWRVLLTLEPFAPQLVVSLLLLSATSSVFYDWGSVGFDRGSVGLIAGIFLGTAAVFVALSWLASQLQPGIIRVITHFVVSLVSLTSKGYITPRILHPENWWEEWLTRLPGDLTASALIWLVIAVLVSHRSEYVSLVTQARDTRTSLLHQRERRRRVADELNLNLKRRAIEALQPPIDTISGYLQRKGSQANVDRVSLQLRKLIDDTVRPLSADLAQPAGDHVTPFATAGALPQPASLKDLQVDLRTDMAIVVPYLLSSINVIVTVTQLSTLPVGAAVFVTSISFWLLIELARRMGPWRSALGYRHALLTTTIIGTLAYVPTGLVLWLFTSSFPDLGPVIVTAGLIYVSVAVWATIWRALVRARREELDELMRIADELNREIGLTNQTIWVVTRKWSHLIHGTVQSALTIAIAQLAKDQAKPSVDKVLDSLSTAKSALNGFFNREEDLADLLAEIVDAWSGVCDVTISLEPDTVRYVGSQANPRVAVNEVVKEAVSNAYRHGGASRVDVSGGPNSEGNLALTIVNNGTPFEWEPERSVGFDMFDQLTMSWSIREDRLGIEAVIALHSPE